MLILTLQKIFFVFLHIHKLQDVSLPNIKENKKLFFYNNLETTIEKIPLFSEADTAVAITAATDDFRQFKQRVLIRIYVLTLLQKSMEKYLDKCNLKVEFKSPKFI